MRALLLIVFLFVASVVCIQRLPAYANRDTGSLLLVPTVRIGSGAHERYFVLDGAGGNGLVLNYDPAALSSTVTAGREMIIVAGTKMWLPYTIDPAAVAAYSIPNLRGTLSLDRASQLWMVFDIARIGLDGLSFPSRDRLENLAWNDCDLGVTNAMCSLPGAVQGTPAQIVFSLDRGVIALPPLVYNAYIGGRSVDSSPSDWHDLQITIGSTTIRIPPRHILAAGPWQSQRLMIVQGVDGEVRVGQEILYAASVFFDAANNRIALQQTDTNWLWSYYAGVGLILGAILFTKALFESFVFDPAENLGTVKHYIIEIAGLLLPVAAILDWRLWGIWLTSHTNTAFLVFAVLHVAFYLTFGVIGMVGLMIAGGHTNTGMFSYTSKEAFYDVSARMQMAAFRRFSVRSGIIFAVMLFGMEVRAEYLFSTIPDVLTVFAAFFHILMYVFTIVAVFEIGTSNRFSSMWFMFVYLSTLLFIPEMVLLSLQLFWPVLNTVITRGGPILSLSFVALALFTVYIFTSKNPVARARAPFRKYMKKMKVN